MVRRIRQVRPDLGFSVSFTTRAARPGEIDGVHYRFLTREMFEDIAREGGFLEWAEVFGELYATSAAEVRAALEEGRHVLKEVDVQGAAQIREKMPDVVLIFLAPPSEAELARRLRTRGTEAGPDLERRLTEARKEMAQAEWFDHVVVNDQVEAAVGRVLAIIDSS